MRFKNALLQFVAAPRSIWYHGSPFKNLRSILTQGLIPDVKKREWETDSDAGINRPSRESYGGVYVTTNLSTACGAPRDTGYYGPGRMVLVVMELQPNTMYLDEDDINLTNLSNACPHLSDSSYHAPGYYIALTQPNTPGNWKEALEEIKQDYINGVMKYWKYKSENEGVPMHPELEKRFEELLPSTWEAALTRQTAHAVAKMEDYDAKRAYHEVFYDVPWDDIPPKEQLFPTIAQGESAWRRASEQLTRTLKSRARINPDKYKFRDTARIETPIGYSGSNHILAVAEIREGHQWHENKEPVPIIVHYGTLPEDFFKQWKERKGYEISLIQATSTKQAGSTDTEELDAYDSELTHDLMALHDEVNLHPSRDFDAKNERSTQRYYNYTLRAARSQLIPAITQAAKQSKRQKDIEELIEDAEGKFDMAEHYGSEGLYLKTTSFLEDGLSYLHDAIDIIRKTTRSVPAVRTFRPMQQPAWGAR